MSLLQLENEQAALNTALIDQRAELAVLEDRVKRMRPDSLDVDLLEERISYVLGYAPKDSNVILMP